MSMSKKIIQIKTAHPRGNQHYWKIIWLIHLPIIRKI